MKKMMPIMHVVQCIRLIIMPFTPHQISKLDFVLCSVMFYAVAVVTMHFLISHPHPYKELLLRLLLLLFHISCAAKAKTLAYMLQISSKKYTCLDILWIF